jgi:hypothetical protein
MTKEERQADVRKTRMEKIHQREERLLAREIEKVQEEIRSRMNSPAQGGEDEQGNPKRLISEKPQMNHDPKLISDLTVKYTRITMYLFILKVICIVT